jgi:hypothetical protein
MLLFYKLIVELLCIAGIFKESMEARNRGGIGLSYRPARLHRLAEFIPWNRFLGSINVQKYGLSASALRYNVNITTSSSICIDLAALERTSHSPLWPRLSPKRYPLK